MKYNGIVFADLHVGAMNLEQLHEEYVEMLINRIKEKNKLDFLIIAGDFFDHKFYLNDKESIMAYYMLNELIEACKEKKCKIRIVYGTESHECNQYDILSNIDAYDDVKVIKSVEEEELLPNMNVLYLPEEHIVNKKEYYKDYFQNINKYDYIFGHGVIREVMHEISIHIKENDEKSKRKAVPVFNTAELNKICKGQIFFGHYHLNRNIDDKFFSIGSFSRWKFGEEGSKGYYELECNPEKEKYLADYIENTLAKTYTTISYGYKNDIFKSDEDMEVALNHMDDMLKKDVFDNVKFIFNIPSSVENPEATINYLKERYKYNKNIKLEIQHGYIEEKRERQQTEIDAENSKYGFIFEESLPLEEEVSRFISVEYNKDIPLSNIKIYMYSELSDILSSDIKTLD